MELTGVSMVNIVKKNCVMIQFFFFLGYKYSGLIWGLFVVWFFVKGEKVLEIRVCYKYIVYIIYKKRT